MSVIAYILAYVCVEQLAIIFINWFLFIYTETMIKIKKKKKNINVFL